MQKNFIKLALVSLGLIFMSPMAMSQDGAAILERVDQMLTFDSDMSCAFQMISYRVGEEPTVQEMRLFTRPEEVDGEDKFLALVLRPEVDRGTGYLGVGDNFWIYDPQSRAFSHSTARDNVQDSDVNNDDLGVSSYSDDYQVLSIEEDMLGQIPTHILQLEATNDSVDYRNVRMWVGREDGLPYKVENYSTSGTLMRTILAPKWSRIGEKYIYNKVYFIDELKEGNRTVLSFEDVSLARIPDEVFTKAYLERVNR